MTGQTYDDEYVAKLLAQDAKSAKKTYELVGIDAFGSKRIKSGAPKPNTNFLRHIIRQTDSHNAALLAREAEESNARLKEMNLERVRAERKSNIRRERNADGRLTPVVSDNEESHSRPSRRRTNHKDVRSGHASKRKRRDRSRDSHDEKARSRSQDIRHGKRKCEQSERRSRHSEHHRDRRSHHEHGSDNEDDRSRRKHNSGHRHKKRRSRSRSPSSSRSRSPQSDRAEKKRRYRDRSRSRSPQRRSHHHDLETQRTSRKTRRRSPTPISDSDPLEAIVGPLPPNVQPSVRSRGRGAHKANSMGMDSRFSSTYDPSTDVRQASDAEDDWGEALESFRDRQRWKQQGADRLKAAGFTDAQVKMWEKGDNKDEEDVTWTKRGQAREWDRGKVVDEDGHVELKAEWGRLT